MAKLTEEMVHARTRQSNLAAVSKLNCWGSELQDVSLVRRLPNVEVLSLSVNRIKSLSDFQHCKKLQHLFIRKNDIRDLNQVCYLRDLPSLSSLWLAENPCASNPGYRLAVLKTLPNLEKLDDVQVTAEEKSEAVRHGAYLQHPELDEPYNHLSNVDSNCTLQENDTEGMASESPEEDTDEHYTTRSNSYQQQDYGRQYQRNDYSPEPQSSPVHSSYMRNAANVYHQEQNSKQNGYEVAAATYESEEDCRAQPPYINPPPSAIHIANHQHQHHRAHKETIPDDESPPRSYKQEEDPEEIQPRGILSRSRTESLPRLSRIEPEDAEEYCRARELTASRCRLDTIPRGVRQDLEDADSLSMSHRTNLTRSRTVDMLGGHHAGSMTSLHERERPRQKQCDVYIPRSLQQPVSRARNINVLNAVLCLIKELELQDLEVVAMSVNCRIDELRV